MKTCKYTLTQTLVKLNSEAVDLCEILENNSDLDIDEPMIDFTGDQT